MKEETKGSLYEIARNVIIHNKSKKNLKTL